MQMRTKPIAVFEIAVLVVAVVAFAHFVGAQNQGTNWNSVCNSIAQSNAKIGVGQNGALTGLDGISGLPSGGVTAADLVNNCKNNPDALKRLDDSALLKGVNDNLENANAAGELFGQDSKLMDELNNRAAGGGGFLEKLNSDDYGNVRKTWLSKLGDGEAFEIPQNGAAPKVAGFDKENNILNLGEEGKYSTKINIDQVKASGEKLTLSQDGHVKFKSGSEISPKGEASVGFEGGKWKVDLKGGEAEFSSADVSSKGFVVSGDKGSVIGTNAYGKHVKITGESDFSANLNKGQGLASGKFKIESEEVGQTSYDGKGLTLKSDRFSFNDGKFSRLDSDGKPIATLSPDDAPLSRTNTRVDVFRGDSNGLSADKLGKNTAGVHFNSDGQPDKIVIKDSANLKVSMPEKLRGPVEVDMSKATKGRLLGSIKDDGQVTFDVNGHKLEIEKTGELHGGRHLQNILDKGAKLDIISARDANGEVIDEISFTKDRDTGEIIKTTYKSATVGDVSKNPVSSFFSSIFAPGKGMQGVLGLALVVAAVGGVAALLSKKKKKK
ncbi:hypothetical protein D6817_05225 [Candidatus Pacearchaeota archaeon]|nr:MAG: hypothetical protein D6817_05225 [Candidatus Pacearchaeota archaeon]